MQNIVNGKPSPAFEYDPITVADRLRWAREHYKEDNSQPQDLAALMLRAAETLERSVGKPVIVCLPGVKLEGRTKRPIGSWLAHRNVVRCDCLLDAMDYHNFIDKPPALYVPGSGP